MGTKRLPAILLLLIIILPGCTAPMGKVESNPQAILSPGTLTPAGVPAPSQTAPVLDPVSSGTAAILPTPSSTPSLRVNLEAVGDINLARAVGEAVSTLGPRVVFDGVQPVLDSADVLVGNLECALTAGGDPQRKNFTFAAPPEAAGALTLAGFDVLSLANNHAMDYGVAGLLDTLAVLDEHGIAGVGAGNSAAQAHAPVILVRNGLRLAFLAYVDVPVENNGFDVHTWIASDAQPGIAWADPVRMAADVAAAKSQADVVIVLLHSGYEISTFLPNVSGDQQLEARTAIDAGAALVIGAHPHFLQPIERYHGGLIAYSLGNFVFDGYYGVANASIILRVLLTPAGVQSYDWVPVLIENGLPVLTDLAEAPVIGTLVAPGSP